MTTSPAPTITVLSPSGSDTGPFNTDWTYASSDDVWVYIETDGVPGPDLVEDVDYDLFAGQPEISGGSLTLRPAAVPVGGWVPAGPGETRLIIRRWTVRRQAVALPDAEGHKPRATEKALDRAMRIAEEVSDELDLTVRVSPGMPVPSPADLAAAANAGEKIAEALFKSSAALDGVDGKLEADAVNADPATFSANAPFLPPTEQPDDIPYPIRARLQERRSVMEFIPRVLHAGIRAGTNLIPVHTFIQAALDSDARYLDFPEGTFWIGPTAWLRQTQDGQQLTGAGDGTAIKRLGAAGVPAYPVLVTQGEGVIVTDMSVWCQAGASLPPAINNIAFASGVIVMGDGSYVEGLSIHDAWDNGLSFGRFDTTTGAFNPGQPAGGEAVAIYTYNCGCGIRPDAPGFPRHQAGGGVNNLNGQGIRFRDCIDWFSRTGWINDYASGATATFNNMISYYAQKSRVAGDEVAFPTELERYGGFGCYVAGRVQMQNCEIFEPQADGAWIDGFAHNCNVNGVRVKAARQRGFRIQGRDHIIKNLIAEDCSYNNADTYPAVLIEGTSDGADGTQNSRNIMVDGVITTGAYHTYGLQTRAGGPGNDRKVHGFAANMQLNGTRGLTDNPNYASFALRGFSTSVPPAAIYTNQNSSTQWDGTQIFTGEGTNAVTSPWGVAAGRGQIWIRDRRDLNKRFILGMDGDRGVGVLQALQSGVAPRPIDLNPDPAEVRTFNRNESGQFGENINAAFEVRLANTERRMVFGYDGPNNRGVIQAGEKGVAARKLSLNPYSGDVEIGDGTVSAVFVSIPGIGLRKMEVGAANSDGTGYRRFRCLN